MRLIEDFVGLESGAHKRKKEFFNPEISKKNVGIWKNYKKKETMANLKDKLPDYISEYAE